MSSDLIVTNALVVTGDAAGTVIRGGAVAVAAGRIVRVGPAAEVGAEAARVVDAGGMLLAPGLVNTHCHAGDSLFRGLVEDLPLEPWLATVWRAEGAILGRETVRLGATLGLAETLLGGVTTTMDMFWHPAETVAAARALGVRVSTGGIFFDGPGVDGWRRRERLAEAAAFFDDLRRRRRRAARLLPARRLYRRAGEPRRRQAAGRGAGRALLAPTPPRRRRSRRS